MAAPKLVVNGLDLSAYMQVHEEDGLDPSGAAYWQPQYSGLPALGEGKRHTNDAADNREPVFPLLLEANSRAALHRLISEVDLNVVKGATLEFASDSSDPSSFWTIEGGNCEVNYQYFLTGVALTTRAVLKLSVRPYAHTATVRTIASLPMGSSAVIEFPASGLLGDVYALANLEVQVGSAVASAGRVVMYGVHPHPSHNPYRQATSGRAQAGATVRGASGAVGSQYTAIPVSPTGASGIAYTEFLDPPDAHIGRHRVFGFARSGLSVPIPVYAQDRFGAIIGATAVVTQLDQGKWQLVDFGEIQVPARATGQEAVPTQYVQLFGGGASGASVIASGGLHLAGLMFLPLDYSAGVLRTPGAGAVGSAFGDSFTRYKTKKGQLESFPVSDGGELWSKINGGLGGGISFAERQEIFAGSYNSSAESGVPLNGATGFYSLGSGAMRSDVRVAVYGGIGQVNALFGNSPSFNVASARLVVYPKMQASAAYTKVVWNLGPSPYLAIISGASPGAENLRASAGMPSMIASGYLEGQAQVLTVQALSGRMDVWLATGALSPSPVISASHAELGIPGHLGLQIFNGTVGQSFGFPANYLQVTKIVGNTLGGSAPDSAAREYFRFDSYPEGRVVEANASVFRADQLANYRGAFPKLPPVGSGGAATGPARVVVFQGEIDNVIGNDGANVSLGALERFRFLR